MHATLQPQQQLIAATAERCIRMAVHADTEQLQRVVDLRQRQRDRRTHVRFQFHVERVATGQQLRLCHGGAGRRALRRLGQPVAQLVQQVLAGQILRVHARGQQRDGQQGGAHRTAAAPVAPTTTQRRQQQRHQLRQQQRQQSHHDHPQQAHQPRRRDHQPRALLRGHRAGPAEPVVVALIPARHAGAGLDHAAAVDLVAHF